MAAPRKPTDEMKYILVTDVGSTTTKARFFSGVSRLTMKVGALKARRSGPLSRSERSSSVHPGVKAFGNQASTTPWPSASIPASV